MTVTYRIDSLKQRQPSETDPLLEALCNSPEFIRDNIQDNINEQAKLKEIIAYNCDHIRTLEAENVSHKRELWRYEGWLTRLHLKLACANAKIAGGGHE